MGKHPRKAKNSSKYHTSSKGNSRSSLPLNSSQSKGTQPSTTSFNTWRPGLEIDAERQTYLNECRKRPPDVAKGIYPFKDVQPKLTRADIEWLLVTHEDGRGPVDVIDQKQNERVGLDLRGADLRWADLRNLPLARMLGGFREAEKRNLTAEQIEMAAVHLEGAWLEGADLEEAVLSQAHLEMAHLNCSHLEYADLHKARLEGAHLTQAYLNCANLEQAQMNEANLSEAHLESLGQFRNTILKGVHLENADLRGAYMEKAFLEEAHLEEADLREAHMREVDFCDAHLEGAQFQDAYLEAASLTDAHLEGADLSNAHLEGADLRRAYLESANLSNAYMEDADLRRAFLEGTNFQRAILKNADLKWVHLAGADLYRAHLEGADLKGAHLEVQPTTHVDLERIQKWDKKFADKALKPANLQGVFFDAGTELAGVTLSEEEFGCVCLADAHWGDVNLSVVDWSQVRTVGDEVKARQWQNHPSKINFSTLVLEDYRMAVRANRQLAVVLQSQGLNEEAAHFAYHAQVLQCEVLKQQKKFGRYIFWRLLDILAGYGYQLSRTFKWYIGVNVLCTIAYFVLSGTPGIHLICYSPFAHCSYDIYGYSISLDWWEIIKALGSAFAASLTAFHGRGFFPEQFGQGDLRTYIAAFEAVVGLFIEASFIATFTQRFLGK